jgi:hypothetical protein
MSEAATATPEAPETSASAPTPAPSGDNFVSFADALDKGFESIEKPSVSETAPVPAPTTIPEPPKNKEVIPAAKSDISNPLDILTKRLTGKDESISQTKLDASDDLDIKAPDNLKPEAQTAWARLTKDLRDARSKLKELETKASEAPTNSIEQIDLQNQLESLKRERDEYESELRLSRLESTKEYKQAVSEPLQSIQQEVADLADMYKADPRSIYAAMVEPDPAKRRALLKDVTTTFDPVDSLAIRSRAEELHKVFARRDLLTKDVQTVLQMLETEEKKERENFYKQTQMEIETAYRTEWENMQRENPLLRPIDNNEAWNSTINTIQQQALQIENTELDPRAKAKLTFSAAAMPFVMNIFQDYVNKAQNRISELESLTKELRAVSPSAGASKGSASEIPSDLNFLDALERGLK